MVIDVIRMNYGDIDECLIINEEPNANAAMFFFIF